MSRRQISVAGVQTPQSVGGVEQLRSANLEAAEQAIAAAPGHDVYVLPELSCSGYGPEVFNNLSRLAEDADGPSFIAFSKLAKAHQCFICYGFPRRGENGEFYISAAVVDRDGKQVAYYDKWHVCSTGDCCEKDYFATGMSPLQVFEIGEVRVGLAICYDIRFPELTRKLAAEEGIHLLLHPGGWPRDDGFETWHPFLRVRAMENSIYIMSPNWAGPNNGGTAFCPPVVDDQNRLECLGTEPGVLVGRVDLDRLQDIRREYPYLADRNLAKY